MNKLKISLLFLLKGSFILVLKINYNLFRLLKKLFDKKTIFFVSKHQIRSYSIGSFTQITLLLFSLWVGNIFHQSLSYHSIIKNKSIEISNLKKTNQQFGKEVESLNFNLQKINNYLSSSSEYKSPDSNIINKKNINKKINSVFKNINFDNQTKEIASKIASTKLVLDNIKGATIKKITDLEKALSITGIAFIDNKTILKSNSDNINSYKNIISLNNQNELLGGQGGPFKASRNDISNIKNTPINTNNKFSIKNEIEYLTNLENFINKIPLSAPIKNYYVSSSFGKRVDPIKRNSLASHEGIDFVGSYNTKIISPSTGKIILAGKFGAYGNTLIIDHGYGITTRYGHLSKLHVKKGDNVTKNQIIATQGNTGRSTGHHLHYEIRYKNIALNPKNFLRAGQEIFN